MSNVLSAVEELPFPVISIDKNGNIFTLNTLASSKFEYEETELVGKPLSSLMTTLQCEVFESRNNSNASNQKHDRCDYKVITKSSKWLYFSGYQKRSGDLVVYYFTTEVDEVDEIVTQFSQSRSLISQLKEQNSYLKMAEKISHSGHWRYCVETSSMFWSTELYNIFGTTPDKFTPSSENDFAFYAPSERDEIKQRFFQSISLGKPYYHKSSIKLSSGRKLRLEIIGECEFDSDGNVTALFGICRDVTQNEIVFEKLKLLAMVNYTIKVPIFFIDEQDQVVYQELSPQGVKSGDTGLFNYINFTIEEYLSLKKTARKSGQLKRTHVSFDEFNTVFDFSVTYEAQEGIYIWIVENVTEKFRKEQQQIISNRLALLGNTYGGVSHDINNILGVALGAIEMLEMKVSMGEQNIAKYIDRVKNAIDKGKGVTERLLAFTRKPMVKVVEFDPVQEIIDNKYLFQQMLMSPIKLSFDLPLEHCTINFPKGEFINILLNLVLNSQDAIKEQGLSGEIKVSVTYNENGSVEIHVVDSGIGIESEDIGKIFDPFYSSKSVNKGNGIGLANVYSTVYKHNGAIKVQGKSSLGGAHFMLSFHCKREALIPAKQEDNTGQDLIAQSRILILDDEESIAEFVALFLANLGAKTVQVSDKEALIDAVEHKGKFDIFITDMILPELTGKEAVSIVKRHQPGVQILSMSGYIDSEDDNWPYPLLRKPFNSGELTEFLAHLG